jgi:HAD superfamily phosphatase (TIGR01668 family)
MPTIKLLEPDLVLGDVIIHLTPDLIKQNRLQGLVLDVDETLLPWREKQLSPELLNWVAEVRQIVDLWLVSNNLSQTRINSIASELDLPYIFGAGKPSRRKLRQAVEAMKHPVDRIGMVGDRLFTDVLAGNRLGMFSILVEPMVENRYNRPFSLRNFEVWISQKLGVSLYKN